MHARTRRQRDVLEIITRYAGNHGYHPSYQQIATHLGLKSRSGIARIISDLEDQGLLERSRERGHFSINTSGADAGVLIPWLSVPGLDISDPAASGPLTLPDFMVGSHQPDLLRAFRVRDVAMAPDIELDDIVLIELLDRYRDAQIIVAVVGGKHALIRRFYRAGAFIELADAADNRTRIAADNIAIIGVFRGLLRPAA